MGARWACLYQAVATAEPSPEAIAELIKAPTLAESTLPSQTAPMEVAPATVAAPAIPAVAPQAVAAAGTVSSAEAKIAHIFYLLQKLSLVSRPTVQI